MTASLIFMFLLLPFPNESHAETTVPSGNAPLRITITPSTELNFSFGFPPRRNEFVKTSDIPGWDDLTETEKINKMTNLARCYGNAFWNELPYHEQAGYVAETYTILMRAHRAGLPESDPSYDFSPRIMTCKAFKESNFNTQIGNFYGSSAVGLSQVLEGTLNDLFSERINFRSKVPGYENVKTGEEMRRHMASNPTLQLEVGLAVLEMKRTDHSLSGDSIRPVLERYLASTNPDANANYAQSIYDCADCVKENQDLYTMNCICKAKPDDPNCVTTPNGGVPTCSN